MENDKAKSSNGRQTMLHPVMQQQQPIEPCEQQTNTATTGDMPHKRLIQNIKRFMKDTETKPEMRQKYLEDMLMALPSASKSVF